MENKEENKTRFKESITLKLIIIALISLTLLIPGKMVQNLIHERMLTRNEVIKEINSSWGFKQTVTGPIISIPYKSYQKNGEKVYTIKNYAHFLPEKLDIDVQINPEIRYRGIYEVIVYNALINFKGTFQDIDFESFNIKKEDILWDEASIYLGIPDMRGINEAITFKLNNKIHEANPGIPCNDVVQSGISSRINIKSDQELNFNFSLNINGSESLDFTPVGKITQINMKSNWSTPSFNGNILPDERNIDNNGFTAKWNVLHFNRPYPQSWLNNEYAINSSSFGVGLLMPVDQYQKAERAVKYAIMFIGLTFLVFFFSEVLLKKRIHPVQYLLVGSALLIFYTLLISLAEHISFSIAYLISSISIIALISLFYKTLVKKAIPGIILVIIMVALYVFLYTILKLEDYSLLMGSIGLFIVIAISLFLSGKIDWYAPVNIKINEKRKEKE